MKNLGTDGATQLGDQCQLVLLCVALEEVF